MAQGGGAGTEQEGWGRERESRSGRGFGQRVSHCGRASVLIWLYLRAGPSFGKLRSPSHLNQEDKPGDLGKKLGIGLQKLADKPSRKGSLPCPAWPVWGAQETSQSLCFKEDYREAVWTGQRHRDQLRGHCRVPESGTGWQEERVLVRSGCFRAQWCLGEGSLGRKMLCL